MTVANRQVRVLVALVSTIAVVLGLVSGVAPTAQAASDRPWVSSVATAQLVSDSRSLREAALDAIAPMLTDSAGSGLLAASREASGWYGDGSRLEVGSEGAGLFVADEALALLVDKRVLAASGTTRATLSAGVHDLLLADRSLVAAGLADAQAAVGSAEVSFDALVEAAEARVRAARSSQDADQLAAAEAQLAVVRDARSAALNAVRAGVRVVTRELDAAVGHLTASSIRGAFGRLEPGWVAADGVLDSLLYNPTGTEDADDDGLPYRAEILLGTSGGSDDTDGDGLSDSFEGANVGALDPTGADGDSDLDGDGIPAVEEQRLGSSPLSADTDHDGVDDPDEVEAGTSVTDADSDGDGLSEGDEAAGGTDPTSVDSDGDGIVDVDESLTVTVTNPQGASAQVTGTGRSALDAHAVATYPMGQPNFLAGRSVEFTTGGDGFDSAVITLPYDDEDLAQSEQREQLTVFWLDETNLAWVPVEAAPRVDTEAHTVTVSVSHFSTYAVGNRATWLERLTSKYRPCVAAGTDVVLLDLGLAIDSSGSMEWNDPDGIRLDAAKEFIDGLGDQDRVAVVDFDSTGRIVQPLTWDKRAAKAAVDQIDSQGGTDILAALDAAADALASAADPNRQRVVMLLTDGIAPWLTSSDLARLIDLGIVVNTIGLGVDDASSLQQIARLTTGDYLHAEAAEDLPAAFEALASASDDDIDRDSDGDGLSDCVERRGVWSPYTMERYFPDLNDADSDDDGLPDGEEVQAFDPVDLGLGPNFDLGLDTFTIASDPTNPDTDYDGLNDATELDEDFNPWSSDNDGDDLLDPDEREWGTDPNHPDTDGDGFLDGIEACGPVAPMPTMALEDQADADQRCPGVDGFDPTVFDDPLTSDEWANEYGRGLLFGDAGHGTTTPYLLGNISGSAVSFVPEVGWVVGIVFDLRDTLANTIKTEWVAAGLSVAGVIPYLGDGANILGKARKFIADGGDIGDATATLAKADALPAAARVDLIAELGATANKLRSLGVADESILRFAASRRGLGPIEAILNRAKHSVGAGVGFTADSKVAEAEIGRLLGGPSEAVLPQQFIWLKEPPGGKARIIDWLDGTHAHEVKSGFVAFDRRIVTQIEKDAALKASGKRVRAYTWHFVASARSGSIGADPRYIDLLEEHGINYVIHLP